MRGPNAKGAGLAGGDDEGTVGSCGGGEEGVFDPGEVLIVGLEVPGGGGEELIAVTEKRNGGEFGGESALGLCFFPGCGAPEFVKSVGSGGRDEGGVRTPGEGKNVVAVTFQSLFQREWIEVMNPDGAVGGSGGHSGAIG